MRVHISELRLVLPLVLLLVSLRINAQTQIIDIRSRLELPQAKARVLLKINNLKEFNQFKHRISLETGFYESCLYQWKHNKIPVDCFNYLNIIEKGEEKSLKTLLASVKVRAFKDVSRLCLKLVR